MKWHFCPESLTSCVSGPSKPLIFFLACLPKLNFWRIIDQTVASDYTKFLSNLQFFSCVIEVFSDWWIFKPALEELDEMKFTPKFPQEVGNKTEQNRAIVTIPVTYFCFPPISCHCHIFHIISWSGFVRDVASSFSRVKTPAKKGKENVIEQRCQRTLDNLKFLIYKEHFPHEITIELR